MIYMIYMIYVIYMVCPRCAIISFDVPPLIWKKSASKFLPGAVPPRVLSAKASSSHKQHPHTCVVKKKRL